MIRFNDMRYLPYPIQRDLAMTLARDIDAGAVDKRHDLERLFQCIAHFTRLPNLANANDPYLRQQRARKR
jgi:hypothetical protein